MRPMLFFKVVTPRSGESEDDFISRCMSAEKEAIPDREQRLAACFGKFRRKKREEEGPVRTVGFGGFRFHKRSCCQSCAEGQPCQGTETIAAKQQCPPGQVWRNGRCVPKEKKEAGAGLAPRRRRVRRGEVTFKIA